MQDKNDMAELFLERVTAQDPDNIIAWTLYAILYEQKNQDLNAEITYKKAHKLNKILNTNDNQNTYHDLEASLRRADDGKCILKLCFY